MNNDAVGSSRSYRVLTLSVEGLDYYLSVLKSILINGDFQTWLLANWQCNRLLIKCHVRKALINNMNYNTISLKMPPSVSWETHNSYTRACYNGRDGVSNHQPHDCLLNRLFRRRSKKTPKLRVIGICAGNSPGTGEFRAQMTSNAENVSIWWRHNDFP